MWYALTRPRPRVSYLTKRSFGIQRGWTRRNRRSLQILAFRGGLCRRGSGRRLGCGWVRGCGILNLVPGERQPGSLFTVWARGWQRAEQSGSFLEINLTGHPADCRVCVRPEGWRFAAQG